MSELTQLRLKELFDYNKETGVFTRLVTTNNRGAKAGDIAGYKSANGYLYVSINYKRLLLHRLAWLYVNGKWPDADIDHINGVRTDNRIENPARCFTVWEYPEHQKSTQQLNIRDARSHVR